MTTEFKTVDEALDAAKYYAGTADTPKYVGKIAISQLGNQTTADLYSLTNKYGKIVEVAVSPFRNGFDLWLIVDNGMMQRV